MKILIVDDELVSRSKMMKIVQDLGECHAVESGNEALEFLEKTPDVDLILLDIVMPDIDGYEVYSLLKKKNETKDVNVIFVTALDKIKYEAKGFDLGGMDYITKPFSSKLVQARVRNRLNMIRAQKIKQESVRDEKMLSIGSLAVGMAHEINNPLAGMMQNAQVIINRLTKDISANEAAAKKNGTSMDAIRSYMKDRGVIQQLERINESGIQAAKIVQKILDFTAEERSAMIEENIYQMLEESLILVLEDQAVKDIIELDQLEITKNFPKEPTRVVCDKQKISMVFLSILKNSIQSMQSDGRLIKGSKLKLSVGKNDTIAVIKIEDNGSGMEEEIKKQIFDPLFTTKEVGEGTGLDLALTYFIVTQTHQGDINVKSHPGKGTVFIIELPLTPMFQTGI
ncbi:MAG: response regulator [Desulfobacteraceae bacterium]|nr:response regulator [Desulfobacteraceae bacterium]